MGQYLSNDWLSSDKGNGMLRLGKEPFVGREHCVMELKMAA